MGAAHSRPDDLEEGFDLDRAVERQFGDADGRARMPSPLAENLDHQVGSAVHGRGDLRKTRGDIDEAAKPQATADAIQIAERRLGLREDVDGAAPCRGAPGLDRQAAADLADMTVIELAIIAERELAGDDEPRPGDHKGHIVCDRRRGDRQNDPEGLEAIFDGTHEKLRIEAARQCADWRCSRKSPFSVEAAIIRCQRRSSVLTQQSRAGRRWSGESMVEFLGALHRHFLLAIGTASLALLSLPVIAGDVNPDVIPASVQASIDAIPLASHRAVYDLTLFKAVGSKSPTEARGRIAFDFSGSSCEGYAQNFRQVTELQPAEGPTRVSDMRSATFEDGSGKSFAFKTETKVDDEQSDEVDGRAQRIAQGPVSVALTKPKETKLALDRNVIFPTEHLKFILAAARAGERSLEVKVYDGSDTGDKIYETTTFIGSPIETPAEDRVAQIPALEHMRRWPISISYFDAGGKDESPDYTLSFELYENGISRALRLNYGDFVLAGEIKSLQLLPTPPCPK
jgi:hypothetical protein